MRLADLDWGEVLAALPRWEALSPGARRAFLEVRPSAGAEPHVLGAARDELVAARFVLPPAGKARVYAHAPELRPLLVALRAMNRLRPLDGPGGTLAEAYIQDQFTIEQARALIGERGYPYWTNRGAVAETVSSVEWLAEFLAARPGMPLVRWEQARIPGNERQRLVFPVVGDALHTLVKELAQRPGGVPLRSLPELLSGVNPAYRAATLAAGLRCLLVFVSLRGDGPDAVLGLLPSIARRLGAPPPPPAAVAPAAVFEAPYRISDMTAVLVEAAAEPIPVRGNDGSLYVRSQKAIAARLLRVPEWVGALVDILPYGYTRDRLDEAELDQNHRAVRIAQAVETLMVMRLATVKHTRERFQFAATPAGRAWLALPENERLRQLLDGIRHSPQLHPGWRGGDAHTFDFFGVRLGFALDETFDLRTPLAAALLSAPANAMVPLDAFARYHAETANPFLAPEAARLRRSTGYSLAPRTREGWEQLWRQILTAFVAQRLVPLGGARLGQTAEGLGLALTSVGRYLLGATDEFHLAAPDEGEVIVQPDFEIVFLAPAPRLEAELARFAERTGSGVGALFRITRASVLRAAEQGLAADRVLKTLGQASRTPVPANVARQVKDWFGGTRRVRIAPAVLVECPDTETAARVAGLAGAQATPVTRTLLRLSGDQKSVAALVKKLRAKGIFVEE